MDEALHYEVSEDVIARDVGGEMVLLDLASGLYFGLDPIGGRIWERLSQSRATLGDLVDVIEVEFDAPRDVIERDVATLLQELSGRALVREIRN